MADKWHFMYQCNASIQSIPEDPWEKGVGCGDVRDLSSLVVFYVLSWIFFLGVGVAFNPLMGGLLE